MTSSSVRAISAKSSNASIPTAVVSTVWCAPPAVSQASALVRKSGRGSHTARATGRCGRGADGATTSTTLAVSRNRSRMSASETTTPTPGSAEKTSRTGSSLPPMPSGWTSRLGRLVVSVGQISSMWAPRIRSDPGVRS